MKETKIENKNEEKVVTKTSGGIKALLIILILALIGTSGFIVYDKFIKNDDNKVIEKNETNSKNEKNAKKVDEKKDYVYTLYNGDYYNIPYINIDSSDAKKMNEEIKDFTNYEKREESYNLYHKAKYYFYVNDDIISVVLVDAGETPSSIYYKIFNINKKTGNKATNDEILSIVGLSFEEVKTKIMETYETINAEYINIAKESITRYDDNNDVISLSVYDANKKYINDLDINEVNMYLSNNSELCIETEEYVIAGPRSVRRVYNLTKKSLSDINK